jgi:hypothetical protein
VLNGGDPLAIVDSAIKALRRDATKNRGAFVARFVLLDADLLGRDAERDARCVELAEASEQQLRREWPEYSKNCGRDRLSRRITPASLESVARYEPESAALLIRIGLVKRDAQG